MTEQNNMLNKGDTLPVHKGSGPFKYPLGSLEITKLEDDKLSASYHYYDGESYKSIHVRDHDLSQGPFTIGKEDDNTLVLPSRDSLLRRIEQDQLSEISRYQAIIRKNDEGELEYEHRGSNAIPNPEFRYSRPEMIEDIFPEGGRAGGYSHENREGNTRATNEDRGLAARTRPMQDAHACQYLHNLVCYELLPATNDMIGGSTLSMAMQTKDKHVACSFLGDSPIYMIVQHEETGDVKLMQMGIPHNGVGYRMRTSMMQSDFMPPETLNYHRLKKYVQDDDPEMAALFMNPKEMDKLKGLTHYLGRMSTNAAPNYMPDSFVIHPEKECPKNYKYKGMLVCSDGIEDGTNYQTVQQALTRLLKKNPNAKPNEISKTAVEAALPYTSDNITAMMMPANASPGTLVTVADGNTGTAAVAEKALEVIRDNLAQQNIVMQTVKKKGEYRLSLQGNLISKEDTRQYLNNAIEGLREMAGEQSAQMGAHVVRDTLIIKNPGSKVKNLLDNVIRAQEQSEGRGRI